MRSPRVIQTQRNNLKRELLGNAFVEAALRVSDAPLQLQEVDPDVFSIIECERRRQFRALNLIPSENYTSGAVMEAVGSCLTNKYSEGLPGKR
jgi:hypothetical protein